MDDRAPGYTLVELLVTLAVLAILLTGAVPAFTDLIDSQRLRAAAQQIAMDLRQARAEAVKRHAGTPVGASFSPGEPGCYGISQQLPCDCRLRDTASAGACLLDVSQRRVLHAAQLHARITLLDARFSDGPTTVFDPVRGIARAGTVRLESARGKRLEVRVSMLGRVRICAPADTVSPAGSAPC